MSIKIDRIDQFFTERNKVGIKPGLDRMELLLQAVGNPEKELNAIHIAGTNGKGSTLTYLSKTFETAGYRVGTFSSPSITTRQAMIQINGEPIQDEDFIRYFVALQPIISELDEKNNPASAFEIIVAIAMQFFADVSDIAIIEAGMGGKEDATNCFTPLLSIITSIGLDHVEFLGDTLQEIATHKTGIVKQDRPVVIGKLPESARHVIVKNATKKQAPVYQWNSDFFAQKVTMNQNRQEQFHFRYHQEDIAITLAMAGVHQIENASLSIMSLLLLKENYPSITNEVIQMGVKKAQIPARFEVIHRDPMIIIDGAHNEASINALLATIDRTYPGQAKQLVFAAFQDKPLKRMIEKVDDHFDQIVFTTFEHLRASTSASLYALSSHPYKRDEGNWRSVIDQIINSEQNSRITFVAGSLDFVGKVRQYIK
ncbi:dihydrofolate synthase/folylpolyglutamate synthase [Natronobacillus azotifigens]|uniref:tetrahydrofolate synthase n=1 Tax=Natronobacillus azotifigens TaxID=472978 RepID=A0A9J6RA52_9BACI|nr:folylpolyglutamate synthase/dihydrofolate synthase family protein [Natronobacillus azotifigens]MCZ0702415.1 bifunctional folylpolyglutamate synthase/dihydrofolate synthase [Natronobacillus azotifigens]